MPRIITTMRDFTLSEMIIEQAESEISSGSITPKTFDSRNFFEAVSAEKLSVELIRVHNDIQNLSARYEAFQQHVINLQNALIQYSQGVIESDEFTKSITYLTNLGKKFPNEIDERKSYIDELQKSYDVLQNANILLYEDRYENSIGNSVKRFGVHTAQLEQQQELWQVYTPIKSDEKKSSKSGKSEQEDVSKYKKLHPVEVYLIRHAIDTLNCNNKTVLVDIFARQDNGAINVEKNKPEMHTVVLYWQLVNNKQQILVIDPSNSTFSKHITGNICRLERGDLVAPMKLLKIYVPYDKSNIGTGLEQYRDCTDIAVKIAFGLKSVVDIIDINNIQMLNIFQEITNQRTEGSHLFFSSSDAIARIRQASDDTIRKDINKLLVFFDRLKDDVGSYDSTKTQEVIIKYTELFKDSEEGYGDQINNLLTAFKVEISGTISDHSSDKEV